VILLALSRIEHGTAGDLRGVTDGLAVLRHIGLEDAARRTALELMLLDRRG
jgi:putative component of toxin-antitoxin plasmid stabilization module